MQHPDWELVLLSSILGILTGGFLSITFFRLEEVWKRLIYSILIGGAPIPGLQAVLNNFNPNEIISTWCYIAFFLFMMGSFLFVLVYLLSILQNTRGDSLEIRPTDILLGYKNTITDYYNRRKQEAEINLQEISKNKDKVSKLEYELRKREQILAENIENFNAQSKDCISISFPEYYPIPITNSFLNAIPNRAKQFQRFAFFSSILAEDIGKKYEANDKARDKDGSIAAIKLREFSRGICTYATQHLFSYDIRTHFRYLHNDNCYHGLATSFDDAGHSHKITPIPVAENNLINHSARINRSLLRNFNTEHDYKSKSKRWSNYLTIAFTDHVFLNDDGIPILSMGISIPDNDSFEEMLRFLNFIGIERIIEQTFLQFNGYVNCNEAIKYLSSQPKF